MVKVFAFGCLVLFSVASLSHAYYYNEEGEVESDDGYEASSSSRARSLYTRSTKSAPPPSPSRKGGYNSPVQRARAPTKSLPAFEPQQRIEQQTYEQQSYAPQIQHDVVGRPEPFNFNYDVKDDYGNSQFRKEDSDDTGAVRGSYGYTDANGLYRIVDYVADDSGFHAQIRTNEPGLVEPNPKTGEVENPADVQISPEATPAGVREQQLKYKSQGGSQGGFGSGGSGSYGGSSGGGGSSGSYGSGAGGSASGFGASSSYGGSSGGGGSSFGGSGFGGQQKLRGTKY